MGSSKSKATSQVLVDTSGLIFENPWSRSDVGLVLLNSSLTPIAFNREAIAILNYPETANLETTSMPRVPGELLDSARECSNAQSPPVFTIFNAGKRRYMCQTCCLTWNKDLPHAAYAILLQRKSTASEAINEVAKDFHLTERESQALSGICLGLSSKDLAKRMNISPNTVKAFLRIIMVKMGVTTRAAVVAKILERNARIEVATPQAHGNVQRAAGFGA